MPSTEITTGRRVRIIATDNPFARDSIGKLGVVTGSAPLGMVSLKLDDGTSDYWADTYNLELAA